MHASRLTRLLCITLISACALSAAPPATQPIKPIAAILLDPKLSSTPAASLFDDKVIHLDAATFIDRTQIDRVLQEQQLQSLFTADATKERVHIGNLLKADLLTLLRPATIKTESNTDAPAIEIILCKTDQGLRLHLDTIPLSNDAIKDADALAASFQAGLQRFRQPITIIAAVPPFLTKDLGFEFESNQSAYQKLVEQTLTHHNGLLLVELAEARAIADEITLTAGDISRPLPLYFTGDFRDQSTGGHHTVTITLALNQGNKTLDTKTQTDIPIADAPAFIQSSTQALLTKFTGQKNPAPNALPDPRTEAAQLAEHASKFFRIGNYREALALNEASLLLNPNQLEVHYRAAECIFRIVGRAPVPAPDRESFSRLWRNGIEHAYAFAANTPLIYGQTSRLPLNFTSPPQNLSITPDETRDYVRRLFHAKSAAKTHDATPWAFVDAPGWIAQDDKLAVAISRKLQIVRDCPDAFENSDEVCRFFTSYPAAFQNDTPELRDALRQMKTFPAPISQAAAATMLARLDKGFFPFIDKPRVLSTEIHPPVVEPAKGLSMKISPIKWLIHTTDAKPRLGTIHGILPIGPKSDILWTNTTLYRLDKKSELTPLAQIGACAPCYDGQFIWVSAKSSSTSTDETQHLLAINAETGKIHDFSAADGLPPMPLQWFVATPLAPGHVIAAGGFGQGYIIDLQFDATANQLHHEILLEARDQPALIDHDAWKNIKLAFEPSYAATLTAPQSPTTKPAAQQVLIGRMGLFHPLLIDTQTHKITVVEDELSVPSSAGTHTDHPVPAVIATDTSAIYWTGRDRQLLKQLHRFGHPEFKSVEPNPSPLVPSGQIVFAANGVFILSNDDEHALYYAKNLLSPFQKIDGGLPSNVHHPLLSPSSLHGLILTESNSTESYEIEVTAP